MKEIKSGFSLNKYRRLLGDVSILFGELNQYALPVFKEAGIEPTVENARKFCFSNGKEELKKYISSGCNAFLMNEVEKKFEAMMRRNPKYPNVEPYEQYFKYLVTKQVETFDYVDGKRYDFTATRFSADFDKLTNDAEYIITGDNVNFYKELERIANDLTKVLGHAPCHQLREIFTFTDDSCCVNPENANDTYLTWLRTNAR